MEPVEEKKEKEDKIEYQEFNFEEVKYNTLFTKKFQNRKPYTIPNQKNVIAFLPGQILKIFTKEKKKVKKGEPLLILQAMKMNNVLISPLNGVIKKVYVKTGDTVSKSQLLIELK
jgi:biotin carboxyl carrier protein